MDFVSFLILLGMSGIVSAVLHFGLKFYVTPGLSSYFAKVVIGWFGGYMGIQVLGRWGEVLSYRQVYFVPALFGCLALLVLIIDLIRTWRGPPIPPDRFIR